MADSAPISVLSGPGRALLLRPLLADPRLRRTAFVLAEATLAGEHPCIRRYKGAAVPVTGCACCAPRGDLSRALRTLLPLVRRGEVERVLIEAADPLPALAAVTGDPVLASICHPEGVVTVLREGDGEAFQRQIAMADTIVRDGPVPAGLNPAARVASLAVAADNPASVLGIAPPAAPAATIGGAGVLCLWVRRPVDRDLVAPALRGLISAAGDGLLRIWGVLPVAGGAVLIQSAGHLLHPPVPLPPDQAASFWLACAFQGAAPGGFAPEGFAPEGFVPEGFAPTGLARMGSALDEFAAALAGLRRGPPGAAEAG